MAEPVLIPVEQVPVPVLVAAEQPPIPVIVAPSAPVTVTKGEGTTLAPTTTEADDKVTEGQRHISRVWEYTQATIAVSVTAVSVYVLASLAINFNEVSSNQLIAAGQLNVMTTLILANYFARTNHQNIGGVGKKANESYQGR